MMPERCKFLTGGVELAIAVRATKYPPRVPKKDKGIVLPTNKDFK